VKSLTLNQKVMLKKTTLYTLFIMAFFSCKKDESKFVPTTVKIVSIELLDYPQTQLSIPWDTDGTAPDLRLELTDGVNILEQSNNIYMDAPYFDGYTFTGFEFTDISVNDYVYIHLVDLDLPAPTEMDRCAFMPDLYLDSTPEFITLDGNFYNARMKLNLQWE
jgi:hypothetical protein